jgi:hypothetical protein
MRRPCQYLCRGCRRSLVRISSFPFEFYRLGQVVKRPVPSFFSSAPPDPIIRNPRLATWAALLRGFAAGSWVLGGLFASDAEAQSGAEVDG